MFADRREYTIEFVTLTPMHVGTGEFAELTREGANEPASMAILARDCNGRPWLPPTALKGVLRREALSRGLGAEPGSKHLFGAIRDTKGGVATGGMGLLLMRAGELAGEAPDTSGMPCGQLMPNRDAFVAARTAIDASSGVAEDHKLFFQEMLPAGARFRTSAILLLHGDMRTEAASILDRLLAALLRDGTSMGKSGADGQGQMSVVAASYRELALTAQGVLKERSTRRIAVAEAGVDGRTDVQRAWNVEAHCTGPFLIADSSLGKTARSLDGEFSAKGGSGPQIRAQRNSDNLPLLLGSSVSGALKARAYWIADRLKLRAQIDDPALAIKRLFGSHEQRAILAVRDLKVVEAKPFEITSLRLDRFTGGPVDGALFKTAAFTSVNLKFSLILERRGTVAASADAVKVCDALVTDIASNGLMLGAGTNKGFGWFEARISKGEAHGA